MNEPFFVRPSVLVSLSMAVILQPELDFLFALLVFKSKNALMAENRPIDDSRDTPWFDRECGLFCWGKELRETRLTLCRPCRTAMYRLSLLSTSASRTSKVLHNFRSILDPSSSISTPSFNFFSDSTLDDRCFALDDMSLDDATKRSRIIVETRENPAART